MRQDPRVKLMIVGHLRLDDAFEPFRNRIISVDWVPDVKSLLVAFGKPIFRIAALAAYATTDAKSEIKWLEAAVMGIPSVVSNTARYHEVLEETGVDALIVGDFRKLDSGAGAADC